MLITLRIACFNYLRSDVIVYMYLMFELFVMLNDSVIVKKIWYIVMLSTFQTSNITKLLLHILQYVKIRAENVILGDQQSLMMTPWLDR